MSTQAPTAPVISPRVAPRPRARRKPWVAWLILLLLVAIPAGLWAAGLRPDRLWSGPEQSQLPVFVVDRGEVLDYVVESGSLESADNALARCGVPALLG